jgi:hypothetical protein
MVFNVTFNNIPVILWQSVLLVEETGVPRENRPDYNMYIYEGAFGRINPYIKYGKRHPKPVINPGNLMADISFRCSQGFIFMFRGYLFSLAVTCDRSVFPGYFSFLHHPCQNILYKFQHKFC